MSFTTAFIIKMIKVPDNRCAMQEEFPVLTLTVVTQRCSTFPQLQDSGHNCQGSTPPPPPPLHCRLDRWTRP